MINYTLPAGRESLKDFMAKTVKSDRMSHSYIFEGEKGIGKSTMAEYFSMLVMCDTNSACLNCNKCACTFSDTNPDIIKVDKGDKTTISVEKIRELIKEVHIKPKMCAKRIFIIKEAHLMSESAQNALLKIIETPPEYAIFIMLCENKKTMLKTVLSRSVVIRMPKLKNEELKSLCFTKDFDVSAAYSSGNPGRFLKLCQDDNFTVVRDEFYSCIKNVFGQDEYEIYNVCDFYDKHKEEKDLCFELTISFFSDLMLYKNGVEKGLKNFDKIEIIKNLSERVTQKNTAHLTEIVFDTERKMGKYGSYNMAVQTMLINIWEEIHG